MVSVYEFVVGPLAYLAWGIFLIGSAYRLVSMYRLAKKKDFNSLAYFQWKYSLRSIFHWLIPFGTLGWNAQPLTTLVTFIFHVGVIITPIFLLAHVILWEEFFGISIPTLPDNVADYMTLGVIACIVFLGLRRILQKDVRFVSRPMDWIVLLIVAAPFVTGYLAFHQYLDYQTLIIAHILAGEIMLVAIPFTRLSHIFLWPFTRAYIGCEFGAVRHVRDW